MNIGGKHGRSQDINTLDEMRGKEWAVDGSDDRSSVLDGKEEYGNGRVGPGYDGVKVTIDRETDYVRK